MISPRSLSCSAGSNQFGSHMVLPGVANKKGLDRSAVHGRVQLAFFNLTGVRECVISEFVPNRFQTAQDRALL